MATSFPPRTSPARVRQKLQADLRSSLVFFFAGVALIALWRLLVFSGSIPAGTGSSLWAVLAGMGLVLLLIGAVLAWINWSLLRHQRRIPLV